MAGWFGVAYDGTYQWLLRSSVKFSTVVVKDSVRN